MAAASESAGSKAAAAAAAAAAFEDNGDLVQQLGWAHVDALSLDDFVDELSSAPASSASALEVLHRAELACTCAGCCGAGPQVVRGLVPVYIGKHVVDNSVISVPDVRTTIPRMF